MKNNSTISPKAQTRNYITRFIFVLAILFGGYLMVASLSYNPNDAAWSVASSNHEIVNKTGKIGAWIIDFLYASFGVVANIIPLILILFSFCILKYKHSKLMRLRHLVIHYIGVLLLLIGLTILAEMFLTLDWNYPAGGFIGNALLPHFNALLTEFGTFAVAILMILFGFWLSSGILVIKLGIALWNWITYKNEKIAIENEQLAVQAEQKNQALDIIQKTDDTVIDITDISQLVVQNNPETEDDIHIDTTCITPMINISPLGKLDGILDEPVIINENVEPEIAITIVEQGESSIIMDEAHPIEAEYTDPEPVESIVEELNNPEQVDNTIEQPDRSLIHPLLARAKTRSLSKPSTPLPTIDLLERQQVAQTGITKEELLAVSAKIESQLQTFKINVKVKGALSGPVVTRYELELEPGTKVSRISTLSTDIARSLLQPFVRIVEVIPGKPYVGIEVANSNRQIVPLRDVLDSPEFIQDTHILPIALGKDISGKPIIIDLAKTPHLLVAGSTGSGKSVGVNTMILSLLFKRTPEQLRLIMIDPKVVELSVYQGIPHLLTDVVTDMHKAANALKWCVDEMERRYQLLAALQVRNIEGYNEKIDMATEMDYPIRDPYWKPGDSMDSEPPILTKLSYIVVVVDEFADLMMVAGKKVEELIVRLTQKARAIGIHIILATQRPSVDVITGLIKANIPSRIAFTVASKTDSRTILDANGAEALLGRGDMLYASANSSELVRVHGAYMSDATVVKVADDWRARGVPEYVDGILESSDDEDGSDNVGPGGNDTKDVLYDTVVEFVRDNNLVSISSIQRHFNVGFNRAARMMDQMKRDGIVVMRNGKPELNL